MRTGVALCRHLWRNAVPCDEALVMADAQEDRGFDRAAEVTEYDKGDGYVDWDGDGGGNGGGDGYGVGDGYGDGYGDGDGYGYGDGYGAGDGDGAGDSDGLEDGDGAGFESKANWDTSTPYPFPDEAQEVPCEPE